MVGNNPGAADRPLAVLLAQGRTWWTFVLVVVAVQVSTLEVSPTMWQDEVQLVDMGRATLASPPSTWSITAGADGKPRTFVSFVGPVMQEMAFRATFPWSWGPRLWSLSGAVIAGWGMLVWLRRRGTSIGPAMLLAAAFLVDPMFVQSYRGARVDSWAMASVLWGLVTLRAAAIRADRRGDATGFLAGSLFGVACMTWPSAALLGLLALDDWWAATSRAEVEVPGGARGRWRLAGAIVAGFVSTVAGLVGAYFTLRPEAWGQGASEAANVMLGSLSEIVRGTTGAVRLSPLIWTLAIAAAIVAGQWRLGLLSLGAALVAAGTHPYIHRIIYILPYAFALVGAAAESERIRHGIPGRVAGAALLLWALAITMFIRPAIAFRDREARNPAIPFRFAEEHRRLGSFDVYLEPWELYFPGRATAWRMHRALRTRDVERIIASVDVVIAYPRGATGIEPILERYGFELLEPTDRGQGEKYQRGYGGYRVFVRGGGDYLGRIAHPSLRSGERGSEDVGTADADH